MSGRKPSTAVGRRSNTKYDAELKSKPMRSPATTNRSRQRSAPLVSQADLFLRCKVEADVDSSLASDDPIRCGSGELGSRSREHNTRRSRDTMAKDKDVYLDQPSREDTNGSEIGSLESLSYTDAERPYGVQRTADNHFNTGKDGVMRWGHTEKKGGSQSNEANSKYRENYNSTRGNEESGEHPDVFSSNKALPATHSSGVSKTPTDYHHREVRASFVPLDPRERVQSLVDLFRNIAKISGQIVQDNAAHDNEEKKLQTYTEISSSLSQISAEAATAVAPTLAGIIINHELSQRRVENNFKALGDLWENVFDVFVSEMVCVIDGELGNALAKLKKEGADAAKNIMSDCTRIVLPSRDAVGEQKASSAIDEESTRRNGYGKRDSRERMSINSSSASIGHGDLREPKRRRLGSPILGRTLIEPRTLKKDLPPSGWGGNRDSDVDVDVGAEDILQKMKLTINSLTKENSELKTTLHERAIGIPTRSACSSYSTPLTLPLHGIGNKPATPSKSHVTDHGDINGSLQPRSPYLRTVKEFTYLTRRVNGGDRSSRSRNSVPIQPKYDDIGSHSKGRSSLTLEQHDRRH